MTTTPERLVRIETTLSEILRRLEALEDGYNGGGDVEYHRSVRGRLHSIEGTLAALGVVTKQRVRIFKGWQAAALTCCAFATAAAAWYSVLAH